MSKKMENKMNDENDMSSLISHEPAASVSTNTKVKRKNSILALFKRADGILSGSEKVKPDSPKPPAEVETAKKATSVDAITKRLISKRTSLSPPRRTARYARHVDAGESSTDTIKSSDSKIKRSFSFFSKDSKVSKILQTENDELIRKNDELIAENHQLLKENDKLSKAIAENRQIFLNEIAAKNDTIAALEMKTGKLTAQYQDSLQSYNKVLDISSVLNDKVRTRDAKIDSLQSEIREMEAHIAKLLQSQ